VIAERGTHGASITEIADEADVARGALHYFFESKEEIAQSLLRRIGGTYLQALERHLEARIARGSTRLVADVARWHFLGDPAEIRRRLTVWIDFWGQAASQPAIRDVAVEIQEEARRIVERALTTERPDLCLLDDEARRAASAAILGVVEGTLLQWRLAEESCPLDRKLLGESVAVAATAIAACLPAPHARPREIA
jgi:AcrR family transcriptional regulator